MQAVSADTLPNPKVGEEIKSQLRRSPATCSQAPSFGNFSSDVICRMPIGKQLDRPRFDIPLSYAGLLFTAIDFDNFGQLLKAALADLDDLLARDAVVKGPNGHGPDRSDLALQQLAALIIYNPGNMSTGSDPVPSSQNR